MSEDVVGALRTLVESEQNKEHECRTYLCHIKEHLIKSRVIEYRFVETERVGNTGRSDYIISAEIDEGGNRSVRAYLWELKAPQCFIFEEDTRNRIKPTEELIDAENKLLHYYLENKDSGYFHRQYGVTNSDDVKIGGIIIGKRGTRVRGSYDDSTKDRLYTIAKSTRDIFYRSDVTLLTWDDVLAYIQMNETSGKQIVTEEPLVVERDWLTLTENQYESETFEEEGYHTLEERFVNEAFEIPVRLKCKCDHEISDWIVYGGVVSSNSREMGVEQMHVWNNEIPCDRCGRNIPVELEVWEYPEFFLNLAQMPFVECEILNKDEIGEIIGIRVE